MDHFTIINLALLKLGSDTIQNLSGSTLERRVAQSMYGNIKKMLLSSHTWRFAVKRQILQVHLPPDADPDADHGASASQSEETVTPGDNLVNEHDLPEDFLRVVSVYTMQGQQPVDYKIHATKFFTAASESLVLEYVADVNESEFPDYFISALVSRLAADFCMPITDSTSRMESLYRLAELDLQHARGIDNRQEPPKRLSAGILLGARG